jgi:hypothetical protein
MFMGEPAVSLVGAAVIRRGGAEVLTYREMMRRAAPLMGRRPPLVIRVPVLKPRLSPSRVANATPVCPGRVRRLVDEPVVVP